LIVMLAVCGVSELSVTVIVAVPATQTSVGVPWIRPAGVM